MITDLLTWQITLPIAAGALVLGYLLGSIPFGLLLTRAAGLGDIRSIGSGNIGATNVLRTGNKKLAVGTLLLDALKATVAALIGWYAFGPEAGLIAGFAAFMGHLYPVWLGFKGGKGVATYIGTLLGLLRSWFWCLPRSGFRLPSSASTHRCPPWLQPLSFRLCCGSYRNQRLLPSWLS